MMADIQLGIRPPQLIVHENELHDLYDSWTEEYFNNYIPYEQAALHEYLREIKQAPSLSAREERTLAQAVRRGSLAEAIDSGARGAKQLSSGKPVIGATERKLRHLVKTGQEAAVLLGFAHGLKTEVNILNLWKKKKQQLMNMIAQTQETRKTLILSNLWHVVSIASEYTYYGVPLLELIQEGNVGLMEATNKFNYRIKNRFSTYAARKIRTAIRRVIANQAFAYCIPESKFSLAVKLQQIVQQFIQTHGSPPTEEQLSIIADTSVRSLRVAMNLPITVSLDMEVVCDGGEVDLLADYIYSPSVSQQFGYEILKKFLAPSLGFLTQREREILILHYGLGDDSSQPLDLADVAVRLKISPERTQQLGIRAIEKLKHPSRQVDLHGLYMFLRREY